MKVEAAHCLRKLLSINTASCVRRLRQHRCNNLKSHNVIDISPNNGCLCQLITKNLLLNLCVNINNMGNQLDATITAY